MNRVRHFSLWPLMWAAACGASNVLLFGDVELVTCRRCQSVAVEAGAA